MSVVAPSDTSVATEPVTAADEPDTVFRAFQREEFLDWPAWDRLQRILCANGGSYGLSGARGAGKSWLMLRAIEWVREPRPHQHRGGIGLWYPSPSEYRPLDFLASLSDSFATEIDRWLRGRARLRERLALRAILSFLAALGAGLGASSVASGFDTLTEWVLGLAVAALAGAVTWVLVSWPMRRLLELDAETRLVRQRARFSATQREGSEFGAQAGKGLAGTLAVRRERELVERPATLSSLVNDFRALAERAGATTGHVVIAIDELDKMDDRTLVRDLLRDIKGIFEVPRVHFLVSVSTEAAQQLSIGALTGRDAFNSSFYTVVEAQPAEPAALAELLARRTNGGIPRDVALALAVLAGGNAREVLRLADLTSEADDAAEAVTLALRDEMLTFRREIVTALDAEDVTPLLDAERIGAFTALPESTCDAPAGLQAFGSAATGDATWNAAWIGDGFQARFGEAWRRLLVRIAVAGELIATPSLVRDPDLTRRLRDVIIAASQSGEVGRLVFEQGLSIESTPQVKRGGGDEATLEELAARYDEIRATQDAGPARTGAMEGVTAEVRALAPRLDLEPGVLTAALQSEQAGMRVAGLALAEALGDPAAFWPVLDIARAPQTPFEGYQALRALETLSSSVAEPEVQSIVAALDAEWERSAAGDPSRLSRGRRLRERLERRGAAFM